MPSVGLTPALPRLLTESRVAVRIKKQSRGQVLSHTHCPFPQEQWWIQGLGQACVCREHRLSISVGFLPLPPPAPSGQESISLAAFSTGAVPPCPKPNLCPCVSAHYLASSLLQPFPFPAERPQPPGGLHSCPVYPLLRS